MRRILSPGSESKPEKAQLVGKTFKEIGMFKIIVGLIISIALTQYVNAEGDPERGKSLTTLCVACHGADGNSLAGAFPSLAGQGAKYLIKQMKDIKTGVRPVAMMTGQLDNMSDQDLADIAAYFSGQSIKRGMAKQNLVALGEEIYRAGIKRKGIAACTACHAPTGSGNDAAGFPALSGQWPEYLVAQLKAFRVGDRHNDGDSRMMRDTALDMSDAEIEAVSSYIYGLH
jgi:cytochrome c553